MSKSKKELIQESIDSCIEDSLRMEIVRDYQTTIDNPKAREQVAAAELRIKENEEKLVFLNKYIVSNK